MGTIEIALGITFVSTNAMPVMSSINAVNPDAAAGSG
jgi:hypothetical protein